MKVIIGLFIFLFTTFTLGQTSDLSRPLTFADLAEGAKSHKTLEGTLEFLSNDFRSHLYYRTLMYRSLSLQESSYAEPRVIVFGRPSESNFIFAFNGGNHQRAGNVIETIEFSETSNSFIFREIEFKAGNPPALPLPLKEDEIAFENSDLIISKDNPAKCLVCHGQQANPIWDTYPIWPGAYGSVFNRLFRNFNKEDLYAYPDYDNNRFAYKTQDRPFKLKANAVDTEAEGFLEYVKGKAQHPRYKYLPETYYEKGVRRYLAGEKFESIDYSKEIGIDAPFHIEPDRPNQQFQIHLHQLNSKRMLTDISKAGIPRDAFASDIWLVFHQALPMGSDHLELMAEQINAVLSAFPSANPRPSVTQVKERLRSNITEEISMQLAKVRRHLYSFAPDSFTWIPFYDQNGDHRICYGGSSPKEFYEQFVDISDPETEKFAFHSDCDSVEFNTALQFLLEDRGVHLEKYVLNLRQRALTFYLEGLEEVKSYLGISSY